MRWAGQVALMGNRRGVYRAVGRRPLGRRILRREDNIKIDFQAVG